MPHVHVLQSEFDPSGGAKQFALVRPHLEQRFSFTDRLCKESARVAGMALSSELERLKPDILHTMGPEAFRAARVAQLMTVSPNVRAFPRWVASGVAGCGIEEPWLVPIQPYVDAVITFSGGEVERVRTRLMTQCIHKLWPAVGPDAPSSAVPALPESFILASGGFDNVANLKQAIWAFDVLRYTRPELHLVLLGDGPQLQDVMRFARSLAFDDYRVHFAGWQPDVSAYLQQASVVWVTHTVGGCKFKLEAMAAGRPVVAMRNLDLDGMIDGANGILVPPGDAVRMAAVTSGLLANPDRIATTGAVGKRTAATFTVSALEQAVESVYHGLIRKPV